MAIPPKCRGLKGDALADCIDREALSTTKSRNAEKQAARVLAGYSSASIGERKVDPNSGIARTVGYIGGSADATGGTRGMTAAAAGAENVTSGTVSFRCHIIGYHNPKFGNLWEAFMRRNGYGRAKYKAPIDLQIAAIDSAIKKLDEQNSIGAKLERFFTSPFKIITAAFAAYATMGASLGATLSGIIKDDDSIEAAIKKLQGVRGELYDQSLRWFNVFYPIQGENYFPVGSRIRCVTDIGASEVREGTDPITKNFKLWLEEEF